MKLVLLAFGLDGDVNKIPKRRIREHFRELIRAPQQGLRLETMYFIDLISDVGQKELNLAGRNFLEFRILGNDGSFELIDSLI